MEQTTEQPHEEEIRTIYSSIAGQNHINGDIESLLSTQGKTVFEKPGPAKDTNFQASKGFLNEISRLAAKAVYLPVIAKKPKVSVSPRRKNRQLMGNHKCVLDSQIELIMTQFGRVGEPRTMTNSQQHYSPKLRLERSSKLPAISREISPVHSTLAG